MTLPYRLLGREGGDKSPKSSIPGIYGDRRWVEQLDIVNELGGHTGCVNALCWSRSGRLLASGSDDQHVNIHSYLPESSVAPFKLTTSLSTGHTANIFSVKFMPYSDDRTIVTAAGDGDVRVFDIEYTGQSSAASTAASVSQAQRRLNAVTRGVRYLSEADANTRVYRSHADRVKRIVTESSPYLFLTCSEDGEVRQWDLRQPSSAYPAPSHSRSFMSARSRQSVDRSEVPPPLISYARYRLDLNTISCSPTQPHYIALGGAHLHCFLHDRRMLGRDVSRERGQPSVPQAARDKYENTMDQATRCVRRFAPYGTRKMKRTDDGHIYSCKISDYNPNEMVVSWSGDWIYSFDLARSPDARSIRQLQSQTLSKGASSARVRESSMRKRKRQKTSSDSSMEERRAAGPVPVPRLSTSSDADPAGDLVLRVRYQNGQSEEIAIAEEETVAVPQTGSSTGDGSDNIPRAVSRIRSELFEIRRNAVADSPSRNPAPATALLGHAAAYLPSISETIRTWRYPVSPPAEEAAYQHTMRCLRESTYRFVQATGTVARVLGGQLRTAGSGEAAVLAYFSRIVPAPNEVRSLDRASQFAYDFVKAILVWVENGPEELVRVFQRRANAGRASPRFPVPDDAGTEAINEILLPYLASLASEHSIPHSPPRPQEQAESPIFANESEAVAEFGRIIRTGRDRGPEEPAASAQGFAAAAGAHPPQDAVRFWVCRVACTLLIDLSEALDLKTVGLAFGCRVIENERRGETSRLENRPRSLDEDEEMTGSDSHPEESGDTAEGGSEDQTEDDTEDDIDDNPVEDDDNEDEEDEDMDDDYEDNDYDDDDDDDDMGEADEERQFIYASASAQPKHREHVEAHVPCSSHTNVYRGHCNMETVKDVNYYGLHDEYVVSGSDGGHVFIWDKKTTAIVNILEGDDDVVNVIQGHPYEPMMAVSGIDHTVKIFSPDQRARHDARLGINLSEQRLESAGTGRSSNRTRLGRFRPVPPAHLRGEDMSESALDVNREDYDVGMRPPANGGLGSRRCMHRLYEITSNNDQRRQGGLRQAHFTRDMLQQLAARLREQDGGAGAGGQDTGGAGGTAHLISGREFERIIADENCRVM